MCVRCIYKICICTGTGRGWDPPGCPMPSQPGRATERPRPLEDLAERPRGRDLLETWPRDRDR